jgi:hypothetical protein
MKSDYLDPLVTPSCVKYSRPSLVNGP